MSKSFNISAIFLMQDKMSDKIKRLERTIEKLEEQASKSSRRIDGAFKQIETAVNSTTKSVEKMKKAFTFTNAVQKMKELAIGMKNLTVAGAKFTVGATVAGGAVGGAVAMKGLNAAGEREKYGLALKAMNGGNMQAALDRLNELETRAEKLPFRLEDYVNLDIMTQDVGLKLNADETKGLASLAVAKNIDMSMLVRDLKSMETEALKTILGASSQPSNAKGQISFNDFQGNRQSFNNDAKGVADVIRLIAQSAGKKYGGLSDDMGKSYQGTQATLFDTIDASFAKITKSSGLLDKAIEVQTRAANMIGNQEFTNKGTRVVKEIIDTLAYDASLISPAFESVYNAVNKTTLAVFNVTESLTNLDYSIATVAKITQPFTAVSEWFSSKDKAYAGTMSRPDASMPASKLVNAAIPTYHERALPEIKLPNLPDLSKLNNLPDSVMQLDNSANKTATNTNSLIQQAQESKSILQTTNITTESGFSRMITAIEGIKFEVNQQIQQIPNISSTVETTSVSHPKSIMFNNANTGKAPTGTGARK